jgi:hypothetical protein
MPFSAAGLEKAASGVAKAGGGKSDSDSSSIDDALYDAPRRQFKSYRRGGKVSRTGIARLHKGELVLTRKQAKQYKRSGKRR